jgi:hypothetical protein
MTLYRAIRSGQFPAVQLMGRLIIPAQVIDKIIDAALDTGTLVDTEEWATATSDAATVQHPDRGSSGRGSSWL